MRLSSNILFLISKRLLYFLFYFLSFRDNYSLPYIFGLAHFLGSLIFVSGHSISFQLIGTMYLPVLEDTAFITPSEVSAVDKKYLLESPRLIILAKIMSPGRKDWWTWTSSVAPALISSFRITPLWCSLREPISSAEIISTVAICIMILPTFAKTTWPTDRTWEDAYWRPLSSSTLTTW